jgi:L,D-transpeptidase ErfK/SrfK
MSRILFQSGLCFFLAISALHSDARDFYWDEKADSIGEPLLVSAEYKDTLADLGEAHNVGFTEMIQANPELDAWLPGEGSKVLIPSHYLLPSIREGVVINLREYRLYFFPKEGGKVITYPVGIGAAETPSPVVETKVKLKIEQPNWYPPESVRQKYFDENGEKMQRIFLPGPDNPLGPYAIQLDLPDYFIHGTNKEFGIGTKVSHGCIRLFNDDISKFVYELPKKTAVRFIKEPVKLGVIADALYAEIHLDEADELSPDDLYDLIIAQVGPLAQIHGDLVLEQKAVDKVLRNPLGIPQRIGAKLIDSRSEESKLTDTKKASELNASL